MSTCSQYPVPELSQKMTMEEAPKSSPVTFQDLINMVIHRDYDAIRPLLESKEFDANTEDFRGVTVMHYAAELDDVKMIEMIFKYQPRAKINAKSLKTMITPLMAASIIGNATALEALLKYGADTSCQNIYGQTALILAVEAGQEKCFDILLNAGGCDIKIQALNGVNILMSGINHYEIVKKLIKDSDLSQVDDKGATVLHWSSKSAPLSVLNLLLAEPGIDINHKNYEGITPLHFAIRNNRLDCARILIEKGASLLLKDARGYTVFQYAAIMDETEEFLQEYSCVKSELNATFELAAGFGRFKTLKSLIPGVKDDAIDNALIAAAGGSRLECLKFLFEYKNYDLSSHSVIGALIMSIIKNKIDCFRYLYNEIMNGPENLKHQCLLGHDHIIYVAFGSGCTEACEVFLKNGIDPNGTDSVTYLMIASGNGHLEIVKLLLNHGADINRKNENGSALLLAVTNNRLEIVKILLANGADTSISDEKGYTPLISAAYHGYSEMFYELFKATKNVQQSANDGLTPFLASCISGRLSIVEALVKNGAKLDDIDALGNNCLHCAADSATKDVCVLFDLVQKLVNLMEMITTKNKEGKTPLDVLLSHQNQAFLFSVILAKPEIFSLIEAPCVLKIKTIDHHDMCLICRDDFVVGDSATKLPCRHVFHEFCYIEWSVTKPNCPYCQGFPFKVKK